MLLIDLPLWFILMTVIPLGLSFGSFLNVVVYRLPKGLSLSHPPSACPACGTPIKAYDNVPVLGWLWLRGKARCCGVKISPRYPLVELIGGLLAWAIVATRLEGNDALFMSEAALLFVLYFALAMILVAATLIDLDYMILPDQLTLPALLLGVASSPLRDEVSWQMSLICAVGGYLLVWLPFIFVYEKLRGMPGMGGGDAVLMAVAGAWFGPIGLALGLFGAAIQGTAVTGLLKVLGVRLEEPAAVKEERAEFNAKLEAASEQERQELIERMREEDPLMLHDDEGQLMRQAIPFGPFIALAILELVLFYEPISLFIEAWLLLR